MQKGIKKVIKPIVLGLFLFSLPWVVILFIGLNCTYNIGEKKCLYQDDELVIYESRAGALGADYIIGYYLDSLILKEKIYGDILSVSVEYKDTIGIEIILQDSLFKDTLDSALQVINRAIDYLPPIP